MELLGKISFPTSYGDNLNFLVTIMSRNELRYCTQYVSSSKKLLEDAHSNNSNVIVLFGDSNGISEIGRNVDVNEFRDYFGEHYDSINRHINNLLSNSADYYDFEKWIAIGTLKE